MLDPYKPWLVLKFRWISRRRLLGYLHYQPDQVTYGNDAVVGLKSDELQQSEELVVTPVDIADN